METQTVDPRCGYSAIGDYAIIGDCRSAALVARDGSIDWLCWPRFDSPSLFGALLDRRHGGLFILRPTANFTVERRYIDATNVLETVFITADGSARVIDFMPVAAEAQKRDRLWADHQIVRVLEGIEGEVEMDLLCAPRPDYGRRLPRLLDRGTLGIYYEHGARVFIVRSEVPLALSGDRASAYATFTLRQGERRRVSAVYTEGEPAFIPPLGAEADRRLQLSLDWWRAWGARCTYDGPYRDAVLRSALCLKLMTYAPSGAVIAAPTTSLPEKLGGVRNWDYRYCWLRDASLTLQALYDLGYQQEAEAFLSWLLHTTRMSAPELQILYDVYGETRLTERELDHLEGFAGSRPVRVGNGARGQLQLDVYGELLDAVYEFVSRGGRLDGATRRLLKGFGETVCRRWEEPDEGIWEIRGGRQHHTYSKAMCWVALDRLLKLHAQGHVPDIPRRRFEDVRAAIAAAIERRGYSDSVRSYVSRFDGTDVDASLLLLARYRYAEPASARMCNTSARVHERLGCDGLLYRYSADDGLPKGEGAFGICSFWAVASKALQGDVDGAAALFERVLCYANDVGLFAEEIEPADGSALGNFPQAFTHVGLIDAALTLAQARRGIRRQSDAVKPQATEAQV